MKVRLKPDSNWLDGRLVYSSRMQIEESFRDMKSPQYGIGLKEARTYKTKRMRVLVAIATIVNTFAWILGKAAQIQNAHRYFKANSYKDRKVLSNVFVGLKIFKQTRIQIEYQKFKDAYAEIKTLAAEKCFA